MPSVSVIIPAYNASRTLAEALDSVFAQEFRGEVEVIVTNDGSTDSTDCVLERYQDRVQIIRQENHGMPAARNVAIRRSSGEYLAFLDADDVWLPGRLAKTVTALERNPAAVLAFSDYARMYASGNVVQSSTVPPRHAHAPSLEEMLAHWWQIAPTTVTMRRSVWDLCGGFRREARVGFEDLYLFTLAREHGEFEYIAAPLAKFRLSPSDLVPDKWNPRVFIRLIRERYGVRANGVIAEINSEYAASFTVKALRAMDSGDRREALRCWFKAFRYDASYPLRTEHRDRIFRRHNLRRLARILRSRSRAK